MNATKYFLLTNSNMIMDAKINPGEFLMCGTCKNAEHYSSDEKNLFCIKLGIYVHPTRDVSDCVFYKKK